MKLSANFRKGLLQFFVYALGVVSGGSGILVMQDLAENDPPEATFFETRAGRDGLINPLLDCKIPNRNVHNFPAIFPLIEEDLKEWAQQKIANHETREIGVYIRDLSKGPWLGLNERAELKPGSLLKLPLAMGYLKRAERDPKLLESKLTLTDKERLKVYDLQGIQPKVKLELGKPYKIVDLIEAALTHSDNVAAGMLERYDQHSSLRQTAMDIDLPVHQGVPPLRKLTLKDYAGIFDLLYNATYLNHDNSARVLSWLEHADFRRGVAAGVPNTVRVISKFGEFPAEYGTYFTDCGIVYHPRYPYSICVMTSGADEEKLVTVIKELSSWFFVQVDEVFQ